MASPLALHPLANKPPSKGRQHIQMNSLVTQMLTGSLPERNRSWLWVVPTYHFDAFGQSYLFATFNVYIRYMAYIETDKGCYKHKQNLVQSTSSFDLV